MWYMWTINRRPRVPQGSDSGLLVKSNANPCIVFLRIFIKPCCYCCQHEKIRKVYSLYNLKRMTCGNRFPIKLTSQLQSPSVFSPLLSMDYYVSSINYVATLSTINAIITSLNSIKVKIIRRRLRATSYFCFILNVLHCNTSRRVICCFRSVRRIKAIITTQYQLNYK